MRGEARGGKEVAFGEWGLQATESHWITNRQIEAARIAMTRYMKRAGKYGLKFSLTSLTQVKLSAYVWVKVKGNRENWVSPVKRGEII